MQSMPGEGKVYSKKRPEKKHFFLAFIAYLQNDLLKIQTKYKKEKKKLVKTSKQTNKIKKYIGIIHCCFLVGQYLRSLPTLLTRQAKVETRRT